MIYLYQPLHKNRDFLIDKIPCLIVCFLVVFIFTSCNVGEEQQFDDVKNKTERKVVLHNNQQIIDTLSTTNKQNPLIKKKVSAIEQEFIDAGLVNIQIVDSTIQVDVRYGTTNNFMGEVLYKGYHKVYLQKEVADRLSLTQSALKKLDSNLSLVVFDGARPLFIQQKMWDAMDSLPVRERIKFLSNPKHGSIHNFGCAVDLSIKDIKSGKLLDMGAGFDDVRKIAYPRYENEFLAAGKLTQKQIDNRKLLRKVMHKGGFWVIQTEWWHFNAYSRKRAKELYGIIP